MTFFYWQYYYILFLILPMLWFTWRLYKRNIAFLLQIYTVQFLQYYKIQRGLFIKFILINAIVVGVIVYILHPMAKRSSNPLSQNIQNKNTYVHFVLDVSLSMYVREQDTTRIVEAVTFIKNSMGNSDMQFALSVFTDTLVQVVPFTNDIVFLSDALDSIITTPFIQGSSDLDQLFYQLKKRTNNEVVISTAQYNESSISKQLIVLSDWESHTKVDIQRLRTLGLSYDTIFCVLVGSQAALVYNRENVPIKDTEGNIVYSTSNPQLAKKVAQALNADYLEVYQSIDIHSSSKATIQYNSLLWIISLFVAILLLGYIVLEI